MIRLNDNYAIDVKDVYILCRLKISNGDKSKGQEYATPIGYFTSLEGAINSFRKEIVKENLKDRDMSLSEAVTNILESNRRVEHLIKEAFGEY